MSHETIDHPEVVTDAWESHYHSMPANRGPDAYQHRPVQASVSVSGETLTLSSPKGEIGPHDATVRTMTTLISHEIVHVVISELVGYEESFYYDDFLSGVCETTDLYSDLHGELPMKEQEDW